MTKERLNQGNKLSDRILLIENFLKAIELKDRTSPIILQAGMSKPIQFDVLPPNVDPLENDVYNTIYAIIREYHKKLQEKFENL